MDNKVSSKQAGPNPTDEASALFMSIGEGAIATDAKAHISRVNQAALDILGYSKSDLIGKWFPEAISAQDEHEQNLLNINRPISQAFINGKPVSCRAYYFRKDGSKIPVFLTVSPLMLGSKPIGAIEVFRDISEELALERAKDEFVAIASHQLRTPATAVKQYLGLLLEGYSDPLTSGQRSFLERAFESNERQLQIVHEILKVTQFDLERVILKPGHVDIRQVARKAVGNLQSTFNKKQQTIVIKEPDEKVIANVDAEQIQIAIENLLENAANYTKNGKKIFITTKVAGNKIQIIIKDQGVGIAKADIPKLFQKFSRIPNPLSLEVSGTGLGLYWAAKIVQVHGGDIKVISKLNQGTSFIINLSG